MWFELRAISDGWLDAGIGDGDTHANPTASYIGDAVGDLLYAVWRSMEGDPETRCSWAEEPGEYRWIFERSGDEVRLRILWFESESPPRPEEQGKDVFQTRCIFSGLGHAIAEGAAAALEKYGAKEYEQRWGHPFPEKLLALIRSRLAV